MRSGARWSAVRRGVPVRSARALLVVGTLALGGCGYSLVRYAGGLGDVRSVAIETPVNATAESGAEFMVADALRSEFLQRGAVTLSENPATADLVLEGRVVKVRAFGESFTSTVRTLEYQLVVALEIEATRRDGRSVPLDARALRQTERFLASADAEAMRKNKQEALRRSSQVLAARVYDALYAELSQ